MKTSNVTTEFDKETVSLIFNNTREALLKHNLLGLKDGFCPVACTSIIACHPNNDHKLSLSEKCEMLNQVLDVNFKIV